MNTKKILTLASFSTFAVVLSLGAVMASSHLLDSFTQTELDTNWEADRAVPTGGVDSVAAFGRDDVARLSLDSEETASGTFQRTEGIKTVGDRDFGTQVQVDLYLDPDWEDKAVRAGFWVVGDDGDETTTGTASRDNLFGIVEFVNLETSDSGDSAQGDHEGWRVWDSMTGWTNLNATTAPFTYGEWHTLGIELDIENEEYHFYINGDHVAIGDGGENFIRELFLNSYNYGLDEFPNLSNDSYAAHWHVGLTEPVNPESMSDCKKGGWMDFDFRNQGQCLRFVLTGQDSR